MGVVGPPFPGTRSPSPAECDASPEVAEILKLAPPTRTRELRRLADRLGAMPSGPTRHEQARTGAGAWVPPRA